MIFDISNFDLNIIAERVFVFKPAVSRAPDSALFGFALDLGKRGQPASWAFVECGPGEIGIGALEHGGDAEGVF